MEGPEGYAGVGSYGLGGVERRKCVDRFEAVVGFLVLGWRGVVRVVFVVEQFVQVDDSFFELKL